MAVIRRNWWQRNRPSLEFYFSLWPIIRIGTAIIREAIEYRAFEICRVDLWLFKRKVLRFNLYRRETDNWEPPKAERVGRKLTRRAKWGLKRKLAKEANLDKDTK